MTTTAPAMQAAVFKPGGGVVLHQVERPQRTPGGVLLRVRACGICGSDLHVLRGGWPPQPYWVGHEIAGEVLEADLDSDLRGGEHVAVKPIISCGHCRYCEGGAYNHCLYMDFVGGSLPGGYADYLHVPTARALHRVPPTLPWEEAALAEPLAVGLMRESDCRVHGHEPGRNGGSPLPKCRSSSGSTALPTRLPHLKYATFLPCLAHNFLRA